VRVSDEPGLPEPGSVVAGKYRVEHALGQGGMGAVFKATHIVSGQAVALKWLRPKLAGEPRASARFIREARASARIRHPNVVDIYGVEEQDGRVFLVFELLAGETLREMLNRGVLGAGECIALLVPAMRGVAAAHAQGVVHRDIKPDNLFLTRDPDDPARRVPKVLDFGISKVAADSPAVEGTLTATGATLGTPHYMSLEQLQGAEIDARTDVYAFGVVLYECLTGKRPFESDNFSAIVVKVATETPAHPSVLRPELPRALGDVVMQSMARVREQRYASMQALIDAVLPFAPVEGAQVETREPQRPVATQAEPTLTSAAAPALAPSRAGSSRPVAVALLLLTATGSAAWWLSARSHDSGAQPSATSTATTLATTAAPGAEPERAEDSSSTTTRAAKGTDTPPPARRSGAPSKFDSGWVYLGELEGGTWVTRYFDGWSGGLPAVGTKISARGRSYVRFAIPDAMGMLAGARSTIGSDQPVAILELARWQDGTYVWARVAPAR
jgi:serine/threonine-protein kinase